jgi:hypothetical protein
MLALRMFGQISATYRVGFPVGSARKTHRPQRWFSQANAMHALTPDRTQSPLQIPVGTLSLLLCERRGAADVTCTASFRSRTGTASVPETAAWSEVVVHDLGLQPAFVPGVPETHLVQRSMCSGTRCPLHRARHHLSYAFTRTARS